MEGREKMIERIAESTGQSYERVEHGINSLINVGVSSNSAGQAFNDLIDEIRNFGKPIFPEKRRKPTNYTKPRNRKKKPKNKRR